MGKKNKVVKLTDRRIRYIIRAKKRGESTKRIAENMKLSPSSVKRVWMHWTKTNDDSSRRILAGGEFDAETTENSLWLLREAMDKFGCLASIEQVLTDRGTQFYANKRDKNGNADSRFEEFLEENKIKHIF